MYAPAIMTAPYATFSTSVTLHWGVKPPAAISRADAVTSPKPNEPKRMVIRPGRVEQHDGERLERWAAGLGHQVGGVEDRRERARADRRRGALEERGRDGRGRPDDGNHVAAVELRDLREQGRVSGADCLGHDRVRV